MTEVNSNSNANPTVAPQGGSGQPAAFDWASQGLDADTLGFVSTKGFKGPGDVLSSYRNMEKLLGVPAENVIKLPKDANDKAGWDAVWGRLGRPAKAEDYKLPIPQGEDGAFAKETAQWFFDAGVPAPMAQAVTEKFNAYMNGLQAKELETYNAKIEAESAELKKEWAGDLYAKNLALAKQAAVSLGVTNEMFATLEKTVGYTPVLKMFQKLGAMFGDPAFDAGGEASGFGEGGMTPEQAQNQIKELRADPGFVKKYLAGDAESRSRMNKLHQIAYPGSLTM